MSEGTGGPDFVSDPYESLKLGNQLCFAIYSAAHAFSGAYKPMLEPLGLTYPQYLVLMVLWEKDGLTVKEIGERLHLDSGTLTPVLKRLEKGGYVRRRRNPSDERELCVELTEAGLAVRDKALAARNNLVCSSGRSENQIQELKRSVLEMRDLLRA